MNDKDDKIMVLEEEVNAVRVELKKSNSQRNVQQISGSSGQLGESVALLEELSSIDGSEVGGAEAHVKLKRMFKALKVQFIKKKKKLIQVLELHKQLKEEFKKKRAQNTKLKEMYIENRDKLKGLAAKHLALKKAYKAATGAGGDGAAAPSESTDHELPAGASTELVQKLKQRVIALKKKVKTLDIQKRQLERRLSELSKIKAVGHDHEGGAPLGSSEAQTSRLLKEKLLKQQSIRRRLERDVEILKGAPSGPRTLTAHKLRLSGTSGALRSSTMAGSDMLAASMMARTLAAASPAPSPVKSPTSGLFPPTSVAERRRAAIQGRQRSNSISML